MLIYLGAWSETRYVSPKAREHVVKLEARLGMTDQDNIRLTMTTRSGFQHHWLGTILIFYEQACARGISGIA